jgi:transposase-like protein
MKCSSCGGANIHRSRIRNARERVITTLTNYRYYRCHDCNARSVLRKTATAPARPRVSWKRRMRTIKTYAKIAVVLIALAIGLYIAAAPWFNMSKPVSRQQKQQ